MSSRCVDCLNEAVERCEISGVPLCAQHLWYTEDGRRISERIAKRMQGEGKTVMAPSEYLNALGSSIALPRLPQAPPPIITRQRNGNDFIALASLITGLLSMVTCFGVALAFCLPPLPLLPLLFGLVGLAGSKNASRPDQARTYSWIGIISGLGFLALVMLLLIGSLAFGTSSLLLPSFYPSGASTPSP